ncbi:Hypothetical predicted protein [Mytilus galloprovincialis]|uniref:G-protein coupled receptors family 1 profile domain-containing protein n=1 Tax=Mytilus galloprovincialis TaxID=29158 RepID=A0A8B6DI17_MYTGA|nr:Hypothetical predicted protein [Mytilus galloprovincialis]
MDTLPDYFFVDVDKYLLHMYDAGTVISYISMLMNIVIFSILCRKTLRSPTTILMQGIAAADLLTALSSYGLEPIFKSQYICKFVEREDIELNMCFLPYPYCSFSHQFSILSFTFHNVSAMITTCLGIQKVIAILFPVWTKNKLTKQKAVICCGICFLLSVAIGIPRHFSVWSEKYTILDNTDGCLVHSGGDDILAYSSVIYLLIQTVLLTICCLVMLISTIFIVYKLFSNKFTGQMTERRRLERRSITMVIVVLIIFFITEVPKVTVYLWWCFNYINGKYVTDFANLIQHSLILIKRYEFAMSASLVDYLTDMIRAIWLMECARLFTIVGCLSNFVIYIMMSTKLRNEIILLLPKMINHCKHQEQINQIRETTHRRTNPIYKTEMYMTEQLGQSRSHDIEMKTSEKQDQCRTHEMAINTSEKQDQSRSHEIDINTLGKKDQSRSHDIEINTSEKQDQSRTHEMAINTSEKQNQSHSQDIEINTSEKQDQSRTHEMAINTSEKRRKPFA